MEFNIYSGFIGKPCTYQFTEDFEHTIAADLVAQEIAEQDATEYGIPLAKAKWFAVETDMDNIPTSNLVGSNYW